MLTYPTLEELKVKGDTELVGDLSVAGAVDLPDESITTAMLAGDVADLATPNLIRLAEVSISKADILTVGGVMKELVAAEAGKVHEFISLVLIFDYATDTYTAGGDITVKNGTTIVSNAIVKTNAMGAGADKIAFAVALDTANGILLGENTALNLVAASDFTDPGTAAGVARAKVIYRTHTTGL